MREDRAFALVAFAGLTVATAVASIGPLSDPDAWWNLRVGQYVLATGRFVGADPWSRFSTHDFVLTEWLGSVGAAVLYEPFGPAALVWLRSVGGILITGLLFLMARDRAQLSYSVLATLVGLLGFSGSISERPQTLGLVLLLVTVMVWRRAALRLGNPTWAALPLAWVFAASHGYWVLGLAVGFVTAAGIALDRGSVRALVRPASWALGALAVSALTPVGPQLLLLPFRVHAAAGEVVGEWERASLGQPLVDIGLLLATAVAATWWWTGTSWWRTLHLCLAVALVVSYARLSAPAFGLLVPLAAEAAQWLAHGVRRSSGGRALDEPIAEKSSQSEARLLMIGALSVLIVATVAAPLTAQHQRHTPTRLTATLGAIPPGSTVFNDYNVASWMLFHYPDLDLVVDTRLEVFDASYVRTYESALNSSPGWAEVVARTGADWAVLRTELPLAQSLSSSGWSTVKTADGYVVLHRGPQ